MSGEWKDTSSQPLLRCPSGLTPYIWTRKFILSSCICTRKISENLSDLCGRLSTFIFFAFTSTQWGIVTNFQLEKVETDWQHLAQGCEWDFHSFCCNLALWPLKDRSVQKWKCFCQSPLGQSHDCPRRSLLTALRKTASPTALPLKVILFLIWSPAITGSSLLCKTTPHLQQLEGLPMAIRRCWCVWSQGRQR